MAEWHDVARLAFRDYSHEWHISGCFILGLAAVLAPLLVLFGLKYGLVTRTIYDVAGLASVLTEAGQRVKTSAAEIEIVAAIDRNLVLLFWVIAAAGMAGYFLSLGASLWANTDRKRRELSVLRLLGFRGGGIMLYPSFHALFTAVLGWLGAVFVYLCTCSSNRSSTACWRPISRPGSPSVFSCPDTWPAPPSSAVASKLSSTGTTTSVRLMSRGFPSLQSECCRRFLPSWLRLGGSAACIAAAASSMASASAPRVDAVSRAGRSNASRR